MTYRNLITALLLITSLMVGTIALATARPLVTAETSPEPSMGDRKRRGVPAPTPSPITRRPKPIQSPKPKN